METRTQELNGFIFEPYDDETIYYLLENKIRMYEKQNKRRNLEMTRNEILVNIQTDIDDKYNTGQYETSHHDTHAKLQAGELRMYEIINELLKDFYNEDDNQ